MLKYGDLKIKPTLSSVYINPETSVFLLRKSPTQSLWALRIAHPLSSEAWLWLCSLLCLLSMWIAGVFQCTTPSWPFPTYTFKPKGNSLSSGSHLTPNRTCLLPTRTFVKRSRRTVTHQTLKQRIPQNQTKTRCKNKSCIICWNTKYFFYKLCFKEVIKKKKE